MGLPYPNRPEETSSLDPKLGHPPRSAPGLPPGPTLPRPAPGRQVRGLMGGTSESGCRNSRLVLTGTEWRRKDPMDKVGLGGTRVLRSRGWTSLHVPRVGRRRGRVVHPRVPSLLGSCFKRFIVFWVLGRRWLGSALERGAESHSSGWRPSRLWSHDLSPTPDGVRGVVVGISPSPRRGQGSQSSTAYSDQKSRQSPVRMVLGLPFSGLWDPVPEVRIYL